MPEWSKKFPNSKKRGIVVKVGSVISLIVVVATVYKPLEPHNRKVRSTLIPPRAKATGVPIARSRIRPPKSRIVTSPVLIGASPKQTNQEALSYRFGN
jgi:hypothetical protein